MIWALVPSPFGKQATASLTRAKRVTCRGLSGQRSVCPRATLLAGFSSDA